MRLLDRLLSDGFGHDLSEKEKKAVEQIRRLLSQSQLIVADNVAEYYSKNSTAGSLPQASDFPNVMLPFETTFIELRSPKLVSQRIDYTGVLLQMLPKGKLEPYWYKDSASAQFFAPGVEWHMVGLIFYQYRGIRPKLISRFTMPVLADGRVLESLKDDGVYYSLQPLMNFPGLAENENMSAHVAHFQIVMMPSFMALSFMHCRNVRMRTEQPPPRLSRKYHKKTGRALLNYKVLLIDHMKQVLESEGHASTEGLKKALHICRGHFKTYGKDGKGLLFGKHAGTVWVPMHARGNAEEGVIVKDYNVK